MKVVLVGINSKFIHPNMAIRYLKANCSFPVDLMEFTIKDDIDFILEKIINSKADVIGFSCYIWNIKLIKKIIKEIKISNENIKIVLGGPETSYEYDDYLLSGLADFIIINEGEITFNQLINSIESKASFKDIKNLAYISNGKIIRNDLENISNLNDLLSPYYFKEDYQDIPKKVQYVELSRGCPYKCSYCLASLEKGLRYFDIDNTFKTIDHLVEKKAKTIKFLDRSFNANKKMALSFFKRLIEKDYPNTIFQFEINGDVLSSEIIDYLKDNLKENYIRFELGVQSTNDQVNLEINRHQNTLKLIENIKKLQTTNVILHLDLIAGLPYEDLSSFKNTFNTIFSLFGQELQLGFLKMLNGTKIKRESEKHEYVYSEDPPYEIISNKYLSKKDNEIIHLTETFLEIYWNKGFMNESVKLIISCGYNPFDFFYELGLYYEKMKISYRNYQLYDIFTRLISFLIEKNIWNQELQDLLKLDYLRYHNIKPKIYWKNYPNKQDVIRSFFEVNKEFKIDDLYKYSLVTEYNNGFLLVIYLPNKKYFYLLEDNKTKRIS
ncbi:MAG: radical SAM protein [Candidatus Izemoplasmatales bacterium]|jgi:radical SAM superfamily enzyme YgiQ (UPF0313 family)|nr:radical SAM protein [Candidatus Izemoplasmatales bacterium]